MSWAYPAAPAKTAMPTELEGLGASHRSQGLSFQRGQMMDLPTDIETGSGRDAALDKLGLDVIHNVGGKFTRRSADVGPKEV